MNALINGWNKYSLELQYVSESHEMLRLVLKLLLHTFDKQADEDIYVVASLLLTVSVSQALK